MCCPKCRAQYNNPLERAFHVKYSCARFRKIPTIWALFLKKLINHTYIYKWNQHAHFINISFIICYPLFSKALHIRNKHLRLNILFNFFKKSAFPAWRAMGWGRSSENIETDTGTETFLGEKRILPKFKSQSKM